MGFLFLDAGKAGEKGFKAWEVAMSAHEVVEVLDDVVVVLSKLCQNYINEVEGLKGMASTMRNANKTSVFSFN